MKARTILFIHTVLFTLFCASSVTISFLLLAHPGFIGGKIVVFSYSILAVLVVGSWPIFGGCPFTAWENDFRKREGKSPYTGPCIDHYANEWFHISLPAKLSTYLLVLILVLPIVLGITRW